MALLVAGLSSTQKVLKAITKEPVFFDFLKTIIKKKKEKEKGCFTLSQTDHKVIYTPDFGTGIAKIAHKGQNT